MKLKPLEDRVILKQVEAKEKTSGGIILPDSAKEKPQIGKVVAVGPGKTQDNGTLSKMSVKKNDKVFYTTYMGNEVKIDGDEFIIIKESDILGIVED